MPATAARPRRGRAWWWAGFAVFLLVVVVAFDAYLHLSKTYPENSDEANILLMANDMLHGNVYLHGWSVSDVPFITTELPEITLLVWMFGLHLNTAHIAAAVTYTLVVAVGMLLAKGSARGPRAIARMALALAIMLAPQPGIGVFVMVFSVGHIGTALPVMLTWLVLDRFGVTAGRPPWQRWWAPAVVAVMIAWALMADPLVLVIAIYPMLAVCLARVVTGLVAGGRNGGGLRGIRTALTDRWLELSLAAAAGLGYLVAWWGGQLLSHAGGYYQNPVPFSLDGGVGRWFMQARVAVHGLLEMFGAYFVPGNAINYYKSGGYLPFPPLSGLGQAIAITRVVCVLLALWGACAIARRFFLRDADFISQLLLAGIVLNIAAYVPTTLADASALNVREIAPVLPFAAVLAARMLSDRLLALGPAVTVAVPAARPIRWRPARPGAHRKAPGGEPPRPSGRKLRLRLIAVPMVALFGWYSFGLFAQADTPAAPDPYAGLEAFLEANNLTYGLGGYWDASVITVGTGGRVTIRAVEPACLQPYPWESKQEWYNANKHVANFLLLSNVPGYFNSFNASGISLGVLNNLYTSDQRVYLNYGGYVTKNLPEIGSDGKTVLSGGRVVTVPVRIWNYVARVYQGNLLSQLGVVKEELNGRPADQSAPPGPANPIVHC